MKFLLLLLIPLGVNADFEDANRSLANIAVSLNIDMFTNHIFIYKT